MPMKNPPHPGSLVPGECIEPSVSPSPEPHRLEAFTCSRMKERPA